MIRLQVLNIELCPFVQELGIEVLILRMPLDTVCATCEPSAHTPSPRILDTA